MPGRRPYRSRVSTRQRDVANDVNAIGLGEGPIVTGIHWNPDAMVLLVTFSAPVIVTSGILAKCRFVDDNDIPWVCEGEATGSGSNVVGFPMAYDDSPIGLTANHSSSQGVGRAVHGAGGAPAVEWASVLVVTNAALEGPKIVRAYLDDGPIPVLELIFNMAVDDLANNPDVFVNSPASGGTIHREVIPAGGGDHNAILIYTVWVAGGTTDPAAGCLTYNNLANNIKGHINGLAMATDANHAYIPGAAPPGPGPQIIAATWIPDDLKLELQFDRNIVPVGDVAGRVTLHAGTSEGWVAASIDDVVDDTATLNMVWAPTFAPPGSTSSAGIGNALAGQSDMKPVREFSNYPCTDDPATAAPILVHAEYGVGGGILALWFNQEIADDGSANNNVAYHFPAALGGLTKSNNAALILNAALVSSDDTTHATAVITAEGTTASNPGATGIKGDANGIAPADWADFPVTIVD